MYYPNNINFIPNPNITPEQYNEIYRNYYKNNNDINKGNLNFAEVSINNNANKDDNDTTLNNSQKDDKNNNVSLSFDKKDENSINNMNNVNNLNIDRKPNYIVNNDLGNSSERSSQSQQVSEIKPSSTSTIYCHCGPCYCYRCGYCCNNSSDHCFSRRSIQKCCCCCCNMCQDLFRNCGCGNCLDSCCSCNNCNCNRACENVCNCLCRGFCDSFCRSCSNNCCNIF